MSKLGEWFDVVTGRAEFKREIKQLRERVGNISNIDLIKQALSGKVVGYWSSDHYKESLNYEGWVYAAINPILNQVGQATIEPKELNDKKHPLYAPLHKPNPEQRLKKFNRMRALQLLLTGICIEWRPPNNGSVLAERFIVPTGIVAPTREGFRITLSSLQGITWSEYPTRLFSILSEILDYEDCTTLRFEHPMILGDGLSPAWAAGDWIDLANAIDTSRTNLMQRGSRPGMKITETDECTLAEPDRERIKKEIKAVMSSPENSGETLYVPKGLIAELLMLTSVELDHVSGFTQTRDAIMAIFGTPPIAAGIMEASSHAEFYAAMLQLTELRVQPLLDDFADADLQTFEDYAYEVPEEFGYKSKRVDDPDQRDQKARTMSEVGGFTFDEIRAVLNYPPLNIKGVTDIPLVGTKIGVAEVKTGSTPEAADMDETHSGANPNPANVGTRGASLNGATK